MWSVSVCLNYCMWREGGSGAAWVLQWGVRPLSPAGTPSWNAAGYPAKCKVNTIYQGNTSFISLWKWASDHLFTKPMLSQPPRKPCRWRICKVERWCVPLHLNRCLKVTIVLPLDTLLYLPSWNCEHIIYMHIHIYIYIYIYIYISFHVIINT